MQYCHINCRKTTELMWDAWKVDMIANLLAKLYEKSFFVQKIILTTKLVLWNYRNPIFRPPEKSPPPLLPGQNCKFRINVRSGEVFGPFLSPPGQNWISYRGSCEAAKLSATLTPPPPPPVKTANFASIVRSGANLAQIGQFLDSQILAQPYNRLDKAFCARLTPLGLSKFTDKR